MGSSEEISANVTSRVTFNKVTLRQILHNQTKGDISRSVFFQYLKQYMAENLLEFWVAVQDFYNQYEPHNKRSSYSMFNDDPPPQNILNEPEKQKDALSEQRLIVLTYIEKESPMQLNISEDLREAILGNLNSATDRFVEGLFDGAQLEAERLMENNYLVKFLSEAESASAPEKNRHTIVTRRTLAPPPNTSTANETTKPFKVRVTMVKPVKVEPSTKLFDILHLNTEGVLSRTAFFKYLERQNASKYLQFWVEVQDYYNAFEPENKRSDYSLLGIEPPGVISTFDNESKHSTQNSIYEKYLSKTANRRIRAKAEIYDRLEKRMNRPNGLRPSNIFDEYHREVEKYLEIRHLKNFLQDAEDRGKQKKLTIIYSPRPPSHEKLHKTSEKGPAPPKIFRDAINVGVEKSI